MEKKIAFIASVKEREQQLKIVINSIYDQVDLIHLVLNWYQEIPDWIKEKGKIFPHLNPQNTNAHDSIWIYLEAENAVGRIEHTGRYYFTMDDDLLYPQNYIDKLIACIEKNERRAVITVHGSIIKRLFKNYFQSRRTFGFSDALDEDIVVSTAGVGTTAFHSSTIKPTLQNFPFPFARDLWASILCAKHKVPIVTIQRPYGWIVPLKTSGETVFGVTNSNQTLMKLKNIAVKEQLLPLLFCKDGGDKYCLITDYNFDEQLLNKCLSTLRGVSDCNKIVFSDRLIEYGLDVLTQYVVPDERKIGIAGSKITTQFRFINALADGSKVISADADLYFLKDPFDAFEKFGDFDIGVTTREDKEYHYPINQGVVMFNVNPNVRNFLEFLTSQIIERTWPPLIAWQKKFNHLVIGNDWCIGQDEMCVAWLERDKIQEKFGVKIVDVGYKYNYCPHADGVHTWSGKHKLMTAYNDRSVAVLHLKSKLKELLLEGKLK